MWIKELLVDILVSLFIITALLLDDIWMRYVLYAYTAILLIAKIAVASGETLLRIVERRERNAPDWAPYSLYLLNTLLLIGHGWWLLAAGWAAIGGLSWLARRKLNRRGSG